VATDGDVAKWNALRPVRVDYTRMREDSDQTDLKQVVACAGGACEII
jgi:ribonucleoside-diphosphate reductase alpha chain